MKLFDFSNKNYGWPYSANTFQFMQEQMLQLQTLGYVGGNTYVVQGCTNAAGIVANGWVAINGEVLPFVGGAVQTNVVIVQTATTASFGDPATGATPQIYNYSFDRYATFGTATTQYAWADFENKDMAKGLLQRLREAETAIAEIPAAINTAVTAALAAYAPTWASITGKPAGLITYGGSVNVGNVVGGFGQEFVVTIPDQGTSDYQVLWTLNVNSGTPSSSTNCMLVVYQLRSATQFKFWIREFEEATQDLIFTYKIVR